MIDARICKCTVTTKGLVTNYGVGEGYKTGGGGASEVLLLQKGAGEGGKSYGNAEGGGENSWGSFYAVA